MPKNKRKKGEDAPEQAAGDPGRAVEAGEHAESDLERAERERDELRALWQRAQADYQNLKRRQLADVEAAARSARIGTLSELLVVLDYLDMALAAQVTTDEARNLRIGVEMTRQQFWHSLESQGVSVIPTAGAFDPALHQAVSTVESEEAAPGTILEVVRRGYRLQDSVLRHAQVKVATAPEAPGGPADPGSEPGAGPDGDDTSRPGA